MMHGQSPVQTALEKLKDIAVTPDQPELYNEAIKIYNPAYADNHPAFVAFPNNVDDIKRCLKAANDTGTPVTIKSGGHCFAGYSTIYSKGFVVSLKNMNKVELQDDMVTVEVGANWGDVYSKLDDTNYVAVGGCVPAVGIGGYILGGGYSMLSRAYGGLACDKAVSYFMVTADGKDVVKASANENQDLFWALKGGGGGNFGALVSVTLQVCPRPSEFIWTRLVYGDTESTEKGLIAVGANLEDFPKELNLDIALRESHGQKVLTLDAVYSDHHEDLVIQALQNLHPTTMDPPQKFKSWLTFTTEYSKQHGFVHYEMEPVYMKGVMIDSIPTSLAKYFANLEIPSECLVQFVHMGGDIKQIPPTSTAFPSRSAEYSFYTYGRFKMDDQKHKDEVLNFATLTYDAVKSSGCTVGSYVNYMDRHLKNWAEEYYGINYKRLCEIKNKWNPIGKGSLHFHQEIGSTWEPQE